MKKQINPTFFAVLLIALGVLSRIINNEAHFWLNFSMIGGLSLFAGAIIRNKYIAFLVPLFSFLLSDIYLQIAFGNGFYDLSQYFTYGAMVLVVLLGAQMKNTKALNVLGYSIGGTLIFWLVSNFGVWFSNLFTHLEPGLTLAATYIRAIPFLQGNGFATELFLGSLFSDLLFSSLLFAAYFLWVGKSVRIRTAA